MKPKGKKPKGKPASVADAEFVAAFERLLKRYKRRIVGTPVILGDGRLAARVDVVRAE